MYGAFYQEIIKLIEKYRELNYNIKENKKGNKVLK